MDKKRKPNNKGYSGGEERASGYAPWLNKPWRAKRLMRITVGGVGTEAGEAGCGEVATVLR
jgi:hypothetical protein